MGLHSSWKIIPLEKKESKTKPTEEKNTLRGIYFIKVTQKIFEIFAALKGADPEFITNLSNFIDATTVSFSTEEEEVFSKQLDEEKDKIFAQIIDEYAKLADPSVKKQLLETLQKLK